MTQSGYEVAAGKISAGKEVDENAGKKAGPKGGDKGVEASPVLYGYGGIVVLGAVLSIVLPLNVWRQGVVLCVAGVVAVMVIQLVHGFPLDVNVREFSEEMDRRAPQGAILLWPEAEGGGR